MKRHEILRASATNVSERLVVGLFVLVPSSNARTVIICIFCVRVNCAAG